jgi:hypothetical protein
MRGSSTIATTRSRTCSPLSPGSSRKFTVAIASTGSTFSFGLPDSIVTAVVVRSSAFTAGCCDSARSIGVANSHKFASGTRAQSGISGASVSKKLRVTPLTPPGSGFDSSRSIARARIPDAVWRGGVDE